MLQRSPDPIFHALADPTRCAIVERLAEGPLSVSELARPFDMSLTAVLQHVEKLEQSQLVSTEKRGRVRVVSLVPHTLDVAERWFAEHRRRWERRFDRLGDLLREEEDPTPVDAPSTKKQEKT